MEPGAVGDPRFILARRRLIDEIRGRGIEELELLRLFDEVPRHLFLPEAIWHRAYEDSPLPIGYGQTASQPSLQAHTLSLLRPRSTDRVLEIGTGSGFLTALLARMTERVYSVERVRELSQRARQVIEGMGFLNAAFLVGDGTIGWRKYAPFQVIVVSAAGPSVPPALLDQLAEGGRMLIPVGGREVQELVLVRRTGGRVVQEVVGDRVTFVPLMGSFGWTDGEGRG